MLRVAITGNIASGKSQAEKFISELGYKVFDSDEIAHEILNDMTEFYGYDVFVNGKIDRKKLGKLVFSDKNVKVQLENIMHPLIKSNIVNIFNQNSQEDLVFVSVPLLYEAKFNDIFDKVIFIKVDSDTQLKRLMKRNNLTKEEALLRINSQLPQAEKENMADYVIDNNSTVDSLKEKVISLINVLCEISNT